MKAILIRDEMPTRCGDCEFAVPDEAMPGFACAAFGYENIGADVDPDETKPGWCPWRPAPERKDEDDDSFSRAMQAQGWNEALKEVGL